MESRFSHTGLLIYRDLPKLLQFRKDTAVFLERMRSLGPRVIALWMPSFAVKILHSKTTLQGNYSTLGTGLYYTDQ